MHLISGQCVCVCVSECLCARERLRGIKYKGYDENQDAVFVRPLNRTLHIRQPPAFTQQPKWQENGLRNKKRTERWQMERAIWNDEMRYHISVSDHIDSGISKQNYGSFDIKLHHLSRRDPSKWMMKVMQQLGRNRKIPGWENSSKIPEELNV